MASKSMCRAPRYGRSPKQHRAVAKQSFKQYGVYEVALMFAWMATPEGYDWWHDRAHGRVRMSSRERHAFIHKAIIRQHQLAYKG